MIMYLIGFMASGKTSFSKKLAASLSCSKIDLDEYIEQKTQLPIKNIFSFWGEEKFREIENECLLEIKTDELLVLSTGGGTPCYNHNMEYMLENGITIFLELPMAFLIQRLIANPKKRPLVLGKSEDEIKNTVEELMVERLPFYNQAAIHFNPIDGDYQKLLLEIKSKLN